MTELQKRQTWQQRSTALLEHQRETGKSIRELADELECSKSRIAQDLTLGAALLVYPNLDKITKYNDAVAYVKKKRFTRGNNT